MIQQTLILESHSVWTFDHVSSHLFQQTKISAGKDGEYDAVLNKFLSSFSMSHCIRIEKGKYDVPVFVLVGLSLLQTTLSKCKDDRFEITGIGNSTSPY
mmetsp:Transcript_126336/g.252445  ORF Transcript_126336/g.252445 Transcript_126336/m.252445 type:complete len:99 (-) Transcript_126336:304-600(-)